MWALEELGLDYELHVLPFPPRRRQPEYLQTNPLGWIPYMEDGSTKMVESTAMVHYLSEKYGGGSLSLPPGHPEYGEFLNWMYMSDTTLTVPLATVLRYSMVEPEERRVPQVVDDHTSLYLGRLKMVMGEHIKTREFLVGDRFTVADIVVCYALDMADMLGVGQHHKPQIKEYQARLHAREAYSRMMEKSAAANAGLEEQSPF